MTTTNPESLTNRLMRFVMKTGRFPAPLGTLGRWVGRNRGSLMFNGCRMIIEDPKEYIQRQIIARGVYEREIADVIMAVIEPGDVFFDVGANIGNHTLVAAKAGAKVYSFEPVPRLAERVRQNVRFNGLASRSEVVNAAVGNAPGTVTLHVAHRKDDGSHSVLPGVAAESIEKTDVPQITLDSFLKTIAPVSPVLMKIDVEGYEARVLDGAAALLNSATPPILVLETGDRLASQLQESANSVLDRLFTAGYEVLLLSEDGTLTGVKQGAAIAELQNYVAIHPRSVRADKLRVRPGQPR